MTASADRPGAPGSCACGTALRGAGSSRLAGLHGAWPRALWCDGDDAGHDHVVPVGAGLTHVRVATAAGSEISACPRRRISSVPAGRTSPPAFSPGSTGRRWSQLLPWAGGPSSCAVQESSPREFDGAESWCNVRGACSARPASPVLATEVTPSTTTDDPCRGIGHTNGCIAFRDPATERTLDRKLAPASGGGVLQVRSDCRGGCHREVRRRPVVSGRNMSCSLIAEKYKTRAPDLRGGVSIPPRRIGLDAEHASLTRVERTRSEWLVADSPKARPGVVQVAREENKRARWTVT